VSAHGRQESAKLKRWIGRRNLSDPWLVSDPWPSIR
jgi:hypothetical protein